MLNKLSNSQTHAIYLIVRVLEPLEYNRYVLCLTIALKLDMPHTEHYISMVLCKTVVSLVNNSLQWRHNKPGDVSIHQPHDCLLKLLYWRISKKTSKLRVTGLCAGNSPVSVEFPAQRASNAENVSIWWRHHVQSHSLALIHRYMLPRNGEIISLS